MNGIFGRQRLFVARLLSFVEVAAEAEVAAVEKAAVVEQIALNVEIAAVIKIADDIYIAAYVEVERNMLRRALAQAQRFAVNQVKRDVVLAEFQNPSVYLELNHCSLHPLKAAK